MLTLYFLTFLCIIININIIIFNHYFYSLMNFQLSKQIDKLSFITKKKKKSVIDLKINPLPLNLQFNSKVYFTEDFLVTQSTHYGVTQRTEPHQLIPILKTKKISPLKKTTLEKKKIQQNNLLIQPIKKLRESIQTLNTKRDISSPDTYYHWKKSEILHQRYELLELIGRGSFGEVIKARDTERKQFVAVKIIRSDKKYNALASQEVNFLIQLRQNDKKGQKNVVKIKNFFKFGKHTCIVFQLLSINLYKLLTEIHFKGLSLETIRKISIQLFTAIAYLNENKIIHGDIKPENIVLKELYKTGIKLIDFGTSLYFHQNHFDYIMSRYYRAPEIIVGHPFNQAIDMWSIGCVLVELYTGRTIFPGKSQKQQLYRIIETLGLPPQRYLKKCSRKDTYFNEHYQLKQQMIIENQKTSPLSLPLKQIISNVQFRKFIERILTWEISDRLTPLQGLSHPWILEGIPLQFLPEHMNFSTIKSKSLQKQQNSETLPKKKLVHKRGTSDNK